MDTLNVGTLPLVRGLLAIKTIRFVVGLNRLPGTWVAGTTAMSGCERVHMCRSSRVNGIGIGSTGPVPGDEQPPLLTNGRSICLHITHGVSSCKVHRKINKLLAYPRQKNGKMKRKYVAQSCRYTMSIRPTHYVPYCLKIPWNIHMNVGFTTCSTDHRLIMAKVAILIAPKRRKPQIFKIRLDAAKLND